MWPQGETLSLTGRWGPCKEQEGSPASGDRTVSSNTVLVEIGQAGGGESHHHQQLQGPLCGLSEASTPCWWAPGRAGWTAAWEGSAVNISEHTGSAPSFSESQWSYLALCQQPRLERC